MQQPGASKLARAGGSGAGSGVRAATLSAPPSAEPSALRWRFGKPPEETLAIRRICIVLCTRAGMYIVPCVFPFCGKHRPCVFTPCVTSGRPAAFAERLICSPACARCASSLAGIAKNTILNRHRRTATAVLRRSNALRRPRGARQAAVQAFASAIRNRNLRARAHHSAALDPRVRNRARHSVEQAPGQAPEAALPASRPRQTGRAPLT